MPLADFVKLLSDPGYLATLMMWFLVAYMVAGRATPPWQITACLFLAGFVVNQWIGKTFWSIGLGWSYAAWAGFTFQKSGGGKKIRRTTRRIRYRRRRLRSQKTPEHSQSSHKRSRHTQPQTEEHFSHQQHAQPNPPLKPDQKEPLWWDVLEVSSTATQPEVKTAYRKLIRKFHPDKVIHLGEEFQKIAQKRTQEINAAFAEAKAALSESAPQ